MPSLKLGCVFLASGHSKRFHGNKLLSDFRGRPLIETILERRPCERFRQTVVVTRYAPVAVSAAERGFTIVENGDETDDIAKTIRLGMEALLPGIDGCMFSVCDQPLLTARSVEALVQAFLARPGSIAALGCQGRRGNPVIFPASLFGELASLPANQQGGAVIAAHPELLQVVEVSDCRELADIDTLEDLKALE